MKWLVASKGKNQTQATIMKIDLSKAYDSVSWAFMRKVLEKMGFPNKFTGWVIECKSCLKFSILVNGSPKGFF